MTEFLKMHGLGNDFIVLDARDNALDLTPEAAQLLADRRFGIGCDQIMILRPARGEGDIFLDMRNQDGSVTGACGNGTRCVAELIMSETGQDAAVIETQAGLLHARRHDGLIEVDMGPAQMAWSQIPLASPSDTLHVSLAPDETETAVCVSMGNPHAVLFVDDVMQVDVAQRGARLEHHPIFPEAANISFATIIGEDKIRMRVFERGVGITSACGSGACAVGVAAHRRGLTGRNVEVVLDGGSLFISWIDDGTEEGRVLMRGPAETAFRGALDGALKDMLLRDAS